MRSLPPEISSRRVYSASSQRQSRPSSAKAWLNAARWARSVSARVPSTSKISAWSGCCIVVSSGVGEYAAGQDVLRLDGLQVARRQLALPVREQAAGLAQAGAVQRVAHAAGVGEMGLPDAPVQVLLQGGQGAVAEAIVLLREHGGRDGEQFLGRVVGKLQVVRDARAHARVALEEGVHPVAVACQDH